MSEDSEFFENAPLGAQLCDTLLSRTTVYTYRCSTTRTARRASVAVVLRDRVIHQRGVGDDAAPAPST